MLSKRDRKLKIENRKLCFLLGGNLEILLIIGTDLYSTRVYIKGTRFVGAQLL